MKIRLFKQIITSKIAIGTSKAAILGGLFFLVSNLEVNVEITFTGSFNTYFTEYIF